ncbi:capsular polysaccharide export protein, LipB/KpsS family [Aeromonas veronii]|uniref:capsular polysaccharide export protein, LipB/KpsS family n=1 Tax=Aeromonas veronii TaxID=654 RepID=UPI003F748170
MRNKHALFHVISLEEIKFYSRFLDLLDKKYSFKPIFITTSLFCFLYLKLKKRDVYLTWSQHNVSKYDKEIDETFNEKVGWLDARGAQNCFSSTLKVCQEITKNKDVSMAFIPSGRLVSHQATITHCRAFNIPIVFSGYGNFPNKTFFDPEGTDRASSLFFDKTRLDDIDIDWDEFEKWKVDYLNKKLKLHIVSQAKKLSLKTYLSRFIRIVFCKIECLIGVSHDINRGWGSLKELKGGDINTLKSSVVTPEKYVLFPLQYSLDAQIILNYHGTYESAISEALAIARENSLPLIIKPHPVENSSLAIDYIMRVINENEDVFLSNANTFELIKNSEFVITVNSTVGLESKLMNKEVIFLGDSIYKEMSFIQCAKYIHSYLVDIDYFADSNIASEEMEKIFKICEVCFD